MRILIIFLSALLASCASTDGEVLRDASKITDMVRSVNEHLSDSGFDINTSSRANLGISVASIVLVKLSKPIVEGIEGILNNDNDKVNEVVKRHNGQKKSEYNDGKQILWHKNGQIEAELNYKDGKKNGKQIYWYKNGQIEAELNYNDDKLNGKWTWWYENGQIKTERNYKDGKPDGRWTTWHKNGQIKAERNYKDGIHKNN